MIRAIYDGLLAPLLHQLRDGDVVLALALILLFCGALASLAGMLTSGRVRAWLHRLVRVALQLGAVLGLEQAYEFTRGRIPHQTDVAVIHAYRLLDFEMSHHFFIESRVEQFFLQFRLIMSAVDLFYVAAHVGVTIGALVLLYVQCPAEYRFARNMLMTSTALALIVFYIYPTAPPRMLSNYGFVDPAQLYHLVGAGGAQPDSYTYNPYAAMPSLHVTYALISGWALFRALRRPWWRVLCAAYPAVMAAVVIISGNHWVLDVIGAAITVALSYGLLAGGGLLAQYLRRADALQMVRK